MKPFKIFTLAAIFAVAALALTAFMRAKLFSKANADAKGFAVVELFTSEGCSSCPPADELVAKLQKESAGQPVYILAYHVDYWNRLGWKDPYSSADFSKRQHDYASYLHLQSVYTPQIVVNGRTEFVGSQESTLRNAIRASLQKPVTAQLALAVVRSDKSQVSLKYTAEGADKNAVLFLALLQKHAQTKVMRGENAGHVLSHVQIVSKLQRVPLNSAAGIANIAIPKGTDNQEVIGFLQNTTGVITAASRVALLPEVSASAAVKNSK
jgi:hypothetical protein